jgi:membrane protease YdiL (CAAX protease family)
VASRAPHPGIEPPPATDEQATRASGGSLLAFFALTFLVAEACFITAAYLSRDFPPGTGAGFGLSALVLMGTFAPAVAALTLTARTSGAAGVGALLTRLVQWQVSGRWYVFAFGYMAAIKLVAALVHRLMTGVWPAFGTNPWYLMVAATVLSTVVGGQAGEELGWRGYALPRMAERMGPAAASVVLGMIWAVWHLPLFYFRPADTFGQSFLAYALQVIALSVAIAWLYWRTGGSLLLTMLMHAAINNTKDIVPSVPRPPANPLLPDATLMSWLGAAVLWIPALYFLARMPRDTRR